MSISRIIMHMIMRNSKSTRMRIKLQMENTKYQWLTIAGAGFGSGFVLKPYGESWRKQCRMVAQDFNQTNTPRYYSLQEKEAAILVCNLIKDPSQLQKSKFQCALCILRLQALIPSNRRICIIILRVTYGYYARSVDDPFLTITLNSMEFFGQAVQPGNFLVDFVSARK